MRAGPTTARTADLPLSVRRSIEVEKERELQDGIARRHVQIATERRVLATLAFLHALSAGPALQAAINRICERKG